MTSLPLSDYFRDGELPTYFLNVVGKIHFHLPGVFLSNPWADVVNGQLWTVPVEAKCYITLAIIAALGIALRRGLLLFVMATLQVVLLFYVADEQPSMNVLFSGRLLILCFLWGIVFYNYRDFVPASRILFSAALALTFVLLSIPGGDYAATIPLTYATVYLGVLNPKRPRLLFSGDYSYGMYLYGFPLQQMFAWISPITHHWYLSILVCVPAAFGAAHLSWHLIEVPAQQLKPLLFRFESWLLATVPRSLSDWLQRADQRPKGRNIVLHP